MSKLSTQAPTLLTIDGHKFSLVAVWTKSIDGEAKFDGYMLFPYDKEPPAKPTNLKGDK